MPLNLYHGIPQLSLSLEFYLDLGESVVLHGLI